MTPSSPPCAETASAYLDAHATTVARLRAGESAAAIARHLGCSRANVYHLQRRYEVFERLRQSGTNMHMLTVRAINCLLAEQIHTVDEAAQALQTGHLKNVPNLGQTTLAEITAWVHRFATDSNANLSPPEVTSEFLQTGDTLAQN